MVKLIEKVKLYFRLILMGRRSTIITFLGLGISLALISQGLLFLYSFQYGAFTGFYNGVPRRQMSVSLSAYDIREYPEQSVPLLLETTNEAMKTSTISTRIKRVDWFLSRGFFTVLQTKSETEFILPELNLYAIPTDYFSTLATILYNGTLPQRIDDVLVVAKGTTLLNTNLSDTGRFPLYTPILFQSFENVIDMGIPTGGQYINISGVIAKEVFSNVAGAMREDFLAMTDYFSDEFLLTSYTNFGYFLSKLSYYPGYAAATGRITFKLDKINSFKIRDEITQLSTFAQELDRMFNAEGFQPLIYNYMLQYLKDFQKEFIIFQLFSLLFFTPLIGMGLSITSYSANLLKRRQKRQVSSMLQRGSSQKEIMFILIVEIVEFTITALLIGFLIGYGFTWFLTKSTYFLEFSGAGKPPLINLAILFSIIGIGFLLSLIVNTKNVWEMSKITTQEAYSEHQVKKAGWQKFYLDIILIVVGIVLWLIVRSQLTKETAYQFAYGFGTTAPVLLVLGVIMFATRLYPIFLKFISNRSWKKGRLGILAIATKRNSRRKSDVTRSLILITLTFTIIFSSLITIQSYENFDKEVAYYNLGSDILIRNVDPTTNRTQQIISSIEGIESFTSIHFTSQIITYGLLTYSYLVIGIDPAEFAKVAYFEKQYLRGQSPEIFFEKINALTDVVMQEDQLKLINTYTGEQFNIRYEKYAYGTLNQSLNVVGIYKYFPRFFVEFPTPGEPIFRFSIIGTKALVNLFAYSNYSIASDILVKVKEGYSISAVAMAIEQQLGRGVDNVEEQMNTFQGSMRNIMLYGSVNSSFLSSLVITVTAIVLMIFIQSIENEREVTTLKVLGMSPKQLFSLFLIEAILVVFFGSIIGIGTGILTAKIFTEILTYQTVIPPTKMIFSPLELSLAAIVLFASAIIAAALTAYIVFRKETIKAMKQI
ncbi:MAG: FtsX-like permease family protein [Candidatus Heimdallarchaeota archaeon]